MTNDSLPIFEDADPSFEDGIGPKNFEHISLETRKKFFPWHKPRKQLLRVEQWASSVEKLVDALNLKENGQPLQYLSLPGPDLLDIRTLHPIFQRKEVNLSFTGLNSGEDDDISSSHLNAALLNQVRALPYIDEESSVVPDYFEHLAKDKSIAYQRIIAAKKSFDVINIDLCSSLAEGMSGVKGPNMINALFNLIKHQAKSRDQDWILFITTRSNKDMVDPGTLSKLINWINKLVDDDKSLIQSLLDKKIIIEDDLSDGKIDGEKFNSSSHSKSFVLGIGHWILNSLFDDKEPSWRVDMLPQFGYHVSLKDKECDMLSLGFFCKKIKIPPKKDAFGLAHVDVPIQPPELSTILETCRSKIIKRIYESSDVDIKLYNDKELYDKYLESSVELLISAQYDEKEYRKFAEIEKFKLEKFLEENKLV